MTRNQGFIPRNDAAFDRFFRNMVDYVEAKVEGTVPAWTHIPPAARQRFPRDYGNGEEAYTPTKVPHSLVETKGAIAEAVIP